MGIVGVKNVGELKKFIENIPDEKLIELIVVEPGVEVNMHHIGDSTGNGIGAVEVADRLILNCNQVRYMGC